MKVFELIDYYVNDSVLIKKDGKSLYFGTADNVPYKFIKCEVIAFGFGDIDDHLTGLIIGI